MDEEEERSGNHEKAIAFEPSQPVKSEPVEITENTVEFTPTNSPSTKVSQHSKNSKIMKIKKGEVHDKKKEENDIKSESSSRSRSKCRNRSRDPRHCQKHFREIIGKHESRNDQLERRESDLRKRLEILECSVPAVTVWNIWRMSQGAPVSSIQRVIEKQFKGPIEERKIFPSTPSQHYDCRVREVEAERKEAQRRAEEARALWAQKELALADKKQKIEEARKAQEDRKKEVARLEAEAKEVREALEKAKGDDVECTEGECGEIKCREIWLDRIGSATSIRSTDLECLSRLQELAETELELKRQIEELERREYAYMKTLEEADVLWAKVKGDAESSIDSLHDQLEAKIIANQELAGRTCQLEDELERMRKQLSAAHSEIKKCKEVQKHEVASGREDDFAGTTNKDITAETDQLDKDVDTGDFIKSISREVTVKPQQMDKDTPDADDLLQTSSTHVSAAPDHTDKSTTSDSDLIKVSSKKITARPNQADQISGRDTGHVKSSDIAVQQDGDSSQQDSVKPQVPKDVASGRPNDYAKVADAGGTIDQEGIDEAQLLIDMYAGDYGACAADFVCNDEAIGIPLEKYAACPPDFKCFEPPETKETEFTEPIKSQPISPAVTSSKRPESIPTISEPVAVKIEPDTSRVQEEGSAKALTEEYKPLKDEVKDEVTDDEILLNMEYLDVPVESTGSTDTLKAGLMDVATDEVVSTRDDLKSSDDGTPRENEVTSISKRDSDDTEIERDTVKQVDITEEGFSGETVAVPMAKLVVDLPEVQEAVTSDGVIRNKTSQVESDAAFSPIPETTSIPMTPVMTPEPEFPSDVASETPFEDAVDTPLELDMEDARDGTTKVLDQDTDEIVPRDTTEIEEKSETGSAASMPETEFQKKVVKDAEPSMREELTTQDKDSDRAYNEIKEERLSQQVEDKSSNAKPEVKMGSERALTPAEEIKSEIFESDEKSSTIEVDEKGEKAAAELERMEEAVPTRAEKTGPAEPDDIEEKNIAEEGIDLGKDKEASEVAKIDIAPGLSREVEKVEAPKVTVKVEPFEVEEEEPRVTADEAIPRQEVQHPDEAIPRQEVQHSDEAIPKSEVKEESMSEDLIDEIEGRKQTFEIKEEEPRVTADETIPRQEVQHLDEAEPKSEVKEESKSEGLIDEIEERKQTFEVKEEEPRVTADEAILRQEVQHPDEAIPKSEVEEESKSEGLIDEIEGRKPTFEVKEEEPRVTADETIPRQEVQDLDEAIPKSEVEEESKSEGLIDEIEGRKPTFEVKEKEPRVTADEAIPRQEVQHPDEVIPKSKVKEESKSKGLIDEIEGKKPTLAKPKVVYEERKKIPTPTVPPPKGPCICKPRTCPLEASRSMKQSPDKPRNIYLTVQQRPARISKICQFFDESKLGSTIRDRKNASPGSRIRRSRCRGSLKNQSTLTMSSAATQTDSSCIPNRKTRETERDKGHVSSGLYPKTLDSPTHHTGGNAIVTATIFSPTCKLIQRGSSNGNDKVSCSSCGKSITQRTSVFSIKVIPSSTNKVSKSLCRECNAQAAGDEIEIENIFVNEKAKMSKEPQSASCEKEICCDCSTDVQDKYESRVKRKRKPETKDYGCLVKIPRVKANAKIQRKDIDIEITTRSRKSEKLRSDSSCGCIEKSTDVGSPRKL